MYILFPLSLCLQFSLLHHGYCLYTFTYSYSPLLFFLPLFPSGLLAQAFLNCVFFQSDSPLVFPFSPFFSSYEPKRPLFIDNNNSNTFDKSKLGGQGELHLLVRYRPKILDFRLSASKGLESTLKSLALQRKCKSCCLILFLSDYWLVY